MNSVERYNLQFEDKIDPDTDEFIGTEEEYLEYFLGALEVALKKDKK